jgi:hypothetical protein
MSRPKREPKALRPTFAVVADGKTEKWYLEMLRQNEPDIIIHFKPQIPNKKKIEDQCELVRSLSENAGYTKVFWIVDLDAIIEDSRQVAKAKETPLQEFSRNTKKFEEDNNVEVIVNNLCLEFWFLLHFEKTSKYFNRCDEAEKQLKKHFPDYEKTEKFFKKQDNDIYLRLKDKLPDALKNSEALGKFNSNDPERAMCEMELFFELMSSIGGKVL